MRVLVEFVLLASAVQSRSIKSDESSPDQLASLLLAATPGLAGATRSKFAAPSHGVTISRRTAPAMIIDPSEVSSMSTMLAEGQYIETVRVLAALAVPAGAALWALTRIGGSAFTQFKTQAIVNERTAAKTKNKGAPAAPKKRTFKERFASVDSGIGQSSRGGR